MREDRVQALVQQMSAQRQASPIREDRVQALLKQMQPQQRETVAGLTTTGYHPQHNPERTKAVARGAIGAVPDVLQQLVAQPTRALVGKVTGIEQPDISQPTSEAIFELMKGAGLDITSPPPKTNQEAIERSALEAAGSVLTPTGLSGLAAKGVGAAARAVPQTLKNIPYLSKGISRAAGLVPEILSGPKSGADALKQAATAASVGAIGQGLEGEGVNPLLARTAAIGLPIGAQAVGRSLAKVPVNPGLQGKKQAQRLFGEEEAARTEALNQLGSPQQLPDVEQYGQALRESIEQPLKMLKAERRTVSGPQYEQLKNIHEKPILAKTNEYLSNVREGIDEADPLNTAISKTEKLLSGNKNPLTAAQAEKKLRLINSEKNKAWKSGDYDAYNFHKETLQNLDNDLQKISEVKNVRKQYAEFSKPINEIANDKRIKSILKKKSGEKGYDILDSGVPSKLIDLKQKSLSDQRHLRKIIGNDESVVNQIKAHNFKNLYDGITDFDGNISRPKLEKYIDKNPGIFVWDPALRQKLSSVDKSVKYLNEVEDKIKSQLGNKSNLGDVLKELTPHGGIGAIAGWALGHSLGGALTGTTIGGAIQGYRHIKQKAFEKTLKGLRKERTK